MKTWQQRVIDERNQLGIRYGRLCEFISCSEEYRELPLIEQNALSRQERVMADYLGVLTERIARFEE